ncbi:uncharacterized protein LOC134254784 [Saccostrea cucullata]|uniref:uncharacterized protein LOC134254784 n=1 Tax=Saccostrea cuccullata TaxID=36930 RepID=UPI002ED3E290
MHWKPFLLVLLIFIINEGTSRSEKATEDNGVITSPFHNQNLKRHREKRRLLGAEHEYFRTYFSEKGLLNVYYSLRHNGLIDDWRPLGLPAYTEAINTSTHYYRSQAEAAYRRRDAADHGGGDRGHIANINNWQNGLELIQGGQWNYACGNTYIIRNELKKRSVRYQGWDRQGFSSPRGGSTGRFVSSRRGGRQFSQNQGQTDRRFIC